MIKQEKQSELDRCRALILATIDYYLERLAADRIVYDGFDPIGNFYTDQKLSTEKYYKQHNLVVLQRKLHTLTEGIVNSADLDYSHYIERTTGFSLHIFQDLQAGIDLVIDQNKIRNQKEFKDVSLMLRLYEKQSAGSQKTYILKKLLSEYYQLHKDDAPPDSTQDTENHLSEFFSPDGKRKVLVDHTIHGEASSTFVTIMFPGTSGCFFAIREIIKDLRAYWQDNNTIVIETKKSWKVDTRYHQVRSLADVIKIIYLEEKSE